MPLLEPEVPALLVRTGIRVWDYGALATARTLGRAGVPVHVQSHPTERELLACKYVSGIVGAPVDPAGSTQAQVEHVNAAVAAVGRPCVAIAGDDETAVLLAEQRAQLDPRLLTAPIPAELPRRLSDKVHLGALAAAAGVPYPQYLLSKDADEIRSFARAVGFPLVLKSPAPFERLADKTVVRTTVVADEGDLVPWLSAAAEGNEIFVQQYLAGPKAQTWYAAGVATGEEVHVWTGRKAVAHPPGTGIGVVNVALDQPGLAQHVAALCLKIDYQGPFDTDWILDPVARTSHLIDFNPRRGAQFRTFQTSSGFDVVRAAHATLTGRDIDPGHQLFGLVHTVENLALLQGPKASPWRYRSAGAPVEFSWYARDDLRPARVMGAQTVASAGRKARRLLPGR